jgi:hypothetical protein
MKPLLIDGVVSLFGLNFNSQQMKTSQQYLQMRFDSLMYGDTGIDMEITNGD